MGVKAEYPASVPYGTRVRYHTTADHARKEERTGYGTFVLHWMCLDEESWMVEVAGGRRVALFPAWGDTMIEVSKLTDMSDCPYFLGIGTCGYGCLTEPRCQTERPFEGWPNEPEETELYQYRADIVTVHDGDTMKLNIDLGFEVHHTVDVRLLGIDCPELGRPDGLGEKARDLVIRWFGDPSRATVVVATTKDRQEKYGRYLADIIDEKGDSLTRALLDAGLAKPYSGRGPKPSWP